MEENKMEFILEIAIGVVLLWFMWLITKHSDNFYRTEWYTSWYKVGRIKQFAKEKKIDISREINEDRVLQAKAIQKTWDQKLEGELSKGLDEVEELKPETKKGK